MTSALPTIDNALLWLMAHWDERVAPLRLHSSATDGIGLAFSPAFAQLLDAHPGQLLQQTEQRACEHWNRKPGELCFQCAIFDGSGKPIAESGVYQKRVLVYRYPFWRAMTKMQNALPMRRSYPHPYTGVLRLAEYGFDWHKTAEALSLPLDFAEAYFLSIVRQLHGRYEEGPIDTRRSRTYGGGSYSWTEISESQQRAITSAESAA